MITCTRRLEFDAGHRVVGHEAKCKHLHGHRYVVEVTARGDLDSVGRVVDFSSIKTKVGGWLDYHWDHGLILWDQDPFAGTLGALCVRPAIGHASDEFQKLSLVPFNPTAENMAQHLLYVVCPDQLRGRGFEVVKVRVWETPNCYAEALA